jgi:hypothetical protein
MCIDGVGLRDAYPTYKTQTVFVGWISAATSTISLDVQDRVLIRNSAISLSNISLKTFLKSHFRSKTITVDDD